MSEYEYANEDHEADLPPRRTAGRSKDSIIKGMQREHDRLIKVGRRLEVEYADLQRQLQQAQEKLLATEVPPGCSHRTKRRYRCYDCDRTFCKRCIKAHCKAARDEGLTGAAIERAGTAYAERDAAIKRAEAAERERDGWRGNCDALMQDVERQRAKITAVKADAAEQRALVEALAELKEHPASCGCVAKQGGLIYTTVCAKHQEQGHKVGRRFGDAPAEAQEEAPDD